LRPDPSPRSTLVAAFRKGTRAAWLNLPAMLALLTAMALVVAAYYLWPFGARLLSSYANRQESGGVIAAALATALAGGVLSEISFVYFQNRGRWTLGCLENMAFKFVVFFIGGAAVYEFYQWQAYFWGNSIAWSIIAAKVIVDQFGFTVLWSTPYNTITMRWQVLRYSGRKLWQELDGKFVGERMLPVLIMNWMFWIPAVVLIYAMPLVLQMPLFVFGVAVWGLLLPAVSRQDRVDPEAISAAVSALPVTPPDLLENQT